jgi:hypothetical protein
MNLKSLDFVNDSDDNVTPASVTVSMARYDLVKEK